MITEKLISDNICLVKERGSAITCVKVNETVLEVKDDGEIIDIPTRYYMKTRDNARVYKVTPKQQNVGLTDFSIGNKANSKKNGWGEEDYKTSGTGAYDANNAFLIKFALNYCKINSFVI